MPDLIRHPEYPVPFFLDSGFRRNDKSLRDNRKFISPKGEGFQPSPKETLIIINRSLFTVYFFETLGFWI